MGKKTFVNYLSIQCNGASSILQTETANGKDSLWLDVALKNGWDAPPKQNTKLMPTKLTDTRRFLK